MIRDDDWSEAVWRPGFRGIAWLYWPHPGRPRERSASPAEPPAITDRMSQAPSTTVERPVNSLAQTKNSSTPRPSGTLCRISRRVSRHTRPSEARSRTLFPADPYEACLRRSSAATPATAKSMPPIITSPKPATDNTDATVVTAACECAGRGAPIRYAVMSGDVMANNPVRITMMARPFMVSSNEASSISGGTQHGTYQFLIQPLEFVDLFAAVQRSKKFEPLRLVAPGY